MDKRERAAQLCFDAAAYIEKHGLAKGELGTEDGRVCLRGGLNVAHHGSPEWDFTDSGAVVDVADDMIESRLDRNPADWNNDPARTAAEVCSELRAAGRDLLALGSLPAEAPELEKAVVA